MLDNQVPSPLTLVNVRQAVTIAHCLGIVHATVPAHVGERNAVLVSGPGWPSKPSPDPGDSDFR